MGRARSRLELEDGFVGEGGCGRRMAYLSMGAARARGQSAQAL